LSLYRERTPPSVSSSAERRNYKPVSRAETSAAYAERLNRYRRQSVYTENRMAGGIMVVDESGYIHDEF